MLRREGICLSSCQILVCEGCDSSKHTDQDRGRRDLVMMYGKQAQYVVAKGQLVVVEFQDSKQRLSRLMMKQSVMASL